MLKNILGMIGIFLLLAPMSARAAQDSWLVAGLSDTGITQSSFETPETDQQSVENDSISIKQAEALLDYRQYRRVEEAMRKRLDQNDADWRAWDILARALEAQGDNEGAAAARGKADNLGRHQWQLHVKLAAFVDSNVVIAPAAIQLAARDQGDIGASVSLGLSGKILDFDHSYTTASFRYDDMIYQDFNNFSLRRVEGGIRHHFRIDDNDEAWLGIDAEHGALGGNSFYSGSYGRGGVVFQMSNIWRSGLEAFAGRRNFNAPYTGYSATRWRLLVHADATGEKWMAGVKLGGGVESTRQREESYREGSVTANGGYSALSLYEAPLWLVVEGSVKRLDYRNIDARLFLRSPLKRKDDTVMVKGGLEWRRSNTLWGGSAAEKWYLTGGWMENRSNMNRTRVVNVAESRTWKKWWSELGVTWLY